jgi:hypothetical protein
MFRTLLAHLQEALHERRFGDCCVMKLVLNSCHGDTRTCSVVRYVHSMFYSVLTVLKIRRSETLTIQQVVSEVVVVLCAFVTDYKTAVYFEVSLDFLR